MMLLLIIETVVLRQESEGQGLRPVVKFVYVLFSKVSNEGLD